MVTFLIRRPLFPTLPSSGSLRLVHRNDGRVVFRQEMAKSEDRACFDLHVVRRGHGNLSVPKHSLGGDQAKAGIDLASEFFSKRVQWSSRNDAVCTEPADQLREIAVAAIMLEGLAIVGLGSPIR